MADLRRGGLSKYNGKIKPFWKNAFFSSILHELRPVIHDIRFFRITWLGLINLTCLFILLNWCHSTKSLGLRSFTYLVFFDTLSLGICALRIWVEQKKPNQQYTFGYERFEVLAIFLSTTFSLISAIFIIKKSVERLIYPLHISIGHYTSGIIIAFLCHMIVTYCMKNKGLNLVVCASSSTYLQHRLSSLSQNFCTNVPAFSTKISPRFNPFVLIGWGACGVLLLAQLIIDLYNYDGADSLAAVCIATMTCTVMYPLSAYSAKILLQGTPPHIADLLDKSLREASTLDGVLEFRNEHFWLLGYDKIVGSVHVRIRRDANEQIVLGHLMAKLSSLVPEITIQVFKDEYAWSSSTLQILNESFKKFPPTTSYPLASNVVPNISDKISLPSYSSLPVVNNFSKQLYSTSVDLEPKSSYVPQYSTQGVVISAASELAPSGSCSIAISNTENISLPNTSSRSANSSRVSIMDFTEEENITINPLYADSTDFTKSS